MASPLNLARYEERRVRLLQLMRKHNLTRRDVASIMGRGYQTVRMWATQPEVSGMTDHALELLEYKLGERAPVVLPVHLR